MNRLRLGSAIAGFALALLSVMLNNSPLGWAAIALLAASLVLRLLLRKKTDKESGTNSPL